MPGRMVPCWSSSTLLSERLGQKDAKTKASETQKEANKAALAQGIEGAEKVTGK
jgi:hypothetical protein